jgi:NADPH:quinone reductase-like Zn-dependent oxidoreductase
LFGRLGLREGALEKTGVLLVTAAGGVGSMVTQLAGALTSLTVVGTASLASVRCRCRLSMASSIWSLVPK